MAVPVPLDIVVSAPPVGWTAQAPNRFQKLVQLIASLLSGSIDASFITGQIGGPAPNHDIGPWQVGDEWWFWDPALGSYQPSQQGCPVGTIAIWCQRFNVPARWLKCTGQLLPISGYPALYDAIGGTWGGNQGNFRLPPDKLMFLNAPGFSPVTAGVDGSQSPDGLVFITGGSQTALLAPNNFPACRIQIPYVTAKLTPGNASLPNTQSPAPPGYAYPVATESYPLNLGTPVGTNQAVVPTMPPFVSIHYIIKYM